MVLVAYLFEIFTRLKMALNQFVRKSCSTIKNNDDDNKLLEEQL